MKDDARIASLLLGCGLLFLVQCDTFKPGDPDRPLSLTPADEATLTVNALDIRLDSSGAVLGISQPGTSVRLVSDAGVWLAGVQDGEVRAVVREFSRSNYRARAADRRLGVFSLTPDSLIGTHITNWPVEYGAPTGHDGKPLILGDMMLWSAFLPEKPEVSNDRLPMFDFPLAELYIAQAVYGYGASELQNVVFLDFEFTNGGAEPFNELYAGFFADVDLMRGGCYSLTANATGYDTVRALSYTYPGDAMGDEDLGCPVQVLGLAFLESPVASEPPQTVTSHTILRKHVSDYYFSEATLRTPEDVLYRLQGLSSQGEPMIDPEAGEPTSYAFTGDPVLETGWLDVATDVRSLSAAGPFTLAAGQKRRFIIAVVWAEGSLLSDALVDLKEKVDTITSRAGLWRSLQR